MFVEISDSEYSEFYTQANPAFFADVNGARFYAIPGPKTDPESIYCLAGSDSGHFLGKFNRASFEAFRQDLQVMPAEELMVKYGSPALQAAYYGVSLN